MYNRKLVLGILLVATLGVSCFGGGVWYASATLPTQDGTWGGDWIRELYGWFTGIHFDGGTVGKLLSLNSGKNVTSTAIGIGSGNDLTGVDDMNATDVFTSNLYANTAWIQGQNRTDAVYYPIGITDYEVWLTSGTSYLKDCATGDILSTSTNATTVIQAGINAAELIQGHIHIHSGNYTIYKTSDTKSCLFVDTSGVTITGDGAGTILYLADNMDRNILDVRNSASNIYIAGIYFNGNIPGGNNDDGSHNACGIRVQSNATLSINVVVEKCIFWSCACNGVLAAGKGHRLINNYVKGDCLSAGLEITEESGIIAGNYLTYLTTTSCLHAIEINSGENSVISNNIVLVDQANNGLQDGILIWTGGSFCTVTGNTIIDTTRYGIHCMNEGTIVNGNTFYRCTANLFDTSLAKTIVTANKFIVNGITWNKAGDTASIIDGNIFDSGATITLMAGTPKIHGNSGYTTESSGSSTILSGQNHVHVTHGLSYTPSINDIHLTRTGPNSNCTALWVDPATITSTEFQVFCGTTSQKNTDANILFNWDSFKP